MGGIKKKRNKKKEEKGRTHGLEDTFSHAMRTKKYKGSKLGSGRRPMRGAHLNEVKKSPKKKTIVIFKGS
jgi:hypothetical protein